MKSKLYVNGDSHSAGHDAGGPAFSYGQHLANALNMEFTCDAVAACSNDSIIARTMKYLESNTPDLLVIGWSTWERETWWHGSESYHITASGTDTVHPELRDQYKQWVIDSCTVEFQRKKETKNHDNIWTLHEVLKNRNIKHLFFNCYSHFFYTDAYGEKKYAWGNNYVNPYDKYHTYYFWLERQGYKPSNPQFYHYGPDAHAAWAEFLLPYIEQL
jgi:hypothetical protein